MKKPEPLRVALYTRISTAEERRQQHIENQLRELRRFARTNKWKVAAEFQDFASGAKDKRPGLDQVMKAAARRDFDRVVIFDLSRLTRGGIAKAFEIIERLDQCNVELWSMTQEHFRTSGRHGQLFIALAAHIAEEERLLLGKRIVAGLERRRAAGKPLGPKRRVVDVAKIRELKEQGKSLREIAATLKVDKMTIARRLNEA